jgi:hypothetical protein
MNFVIRQVKQRNKQIIKQIIKQHTQNIKAHLEPQEPEYLVVCEKQQILVK